MDNQTTTQTDSNPSTVNNVTGFHSIDAINYCGFTERWLATFEEILTNFTKLPKTQAILMFHDRLRQHINDATAHALDLSQFNEQLVNQLYTAYRNQGFTGSVQDMLFAIMKDIEIATIEESISGNYTNKALNVLDWQAVYDRHEQRPTAHEHLSEVLRPHRALNVHPSFYLSYFLQQLSQVYPEDGYTITSWSPEGTLYFQFGYLFGEDSEVMQTSRGRITLWELQSASAKIVCELEVDVGKKNAFIRLKKIQGDRTIIGPGLALPFSNDIVENVVIMYRQDQTMTMRSSIAVTSAYPTWLDDHLNTPITLKLALPLSDRGTAIREIAHYPVLADTYEQLFLLN